MKDVISEEKERGNVPIVRDEAERGMVSTVLRPRRLYEAASRPH
jgi:hypothetical protein